MCVWKGAEVFDLTVNPIQLTRAPTTHIHIQGEIRFAATAAKRLGQLGALTQGDRLACLGSSDLQVGLGWAWFFVLSIDGLGCHVGWSKV